MVAVLVDKALKLQKTRKHLVLKNRARKIHPGWHFNNLAVASMNVVGVTNIAYIFRKVKQPHLSA